MRPPCPVMYKKTQNKPGERCGCSHEQHYLHAPRANSLDESIPICEPTAWPHVGGRKDEVGVLHQPTLGALPKKIKVPPPSTGAGVTPAVEDGVTSTVGDGVITSAMGAGVSPVKRSTAGKDTSMKSGKRRSRPATANSNAWRGEQQRPR